MNISCTELLQTSGEALKVTSHTELAIVCALIVPPILLTACVNYVVSCLVLFLMCENIFIIIIFAAAQKSSSCIVSIEIMLLSIVMFINIWTLI